MMAVAWLDDYFYGGVGGGEVDEVVVVIGGGVLEVGSDGGGGASVFAVSDAEFLELLDASCCHDFMLLNVNIMLIVGSIIIAC